VLTPVSHRKDDVGGKKRKKEKKENKGMQVRLCTKIRLRTDWLQIAECCIARQYFSFSAKTAEVNPLITSCNISMAY
jgi:hypothetical protein